MFNVMKSVAVCAACTTIATVCYAVFLVNMVAHKAPVYNPIDFYCLLFWNMCGWMDVIHGAFVQK